MNEKKELLKNFSWTGFMFLLSLATGGNQGMFLTLVNSVAGNLLSSFIEKIEYRKLRNLLKDTHPSELNHHLRSIIVNAVEWTIKNIKTLYEEELSDESQKSELEKVIQTLLEEVELLKSSLSSEDKRLYEIIERPPKSHLVFEIFDIQINKLPIINEHNSFREFFKNKFVPNLQLCFGELLKMKNNKNAYVAYQREVYQKLDEGIESIISQNNKILSKIEDLEDRETLIQKNQQWDNSRKKITNLNLEEITPDFEAGLENVLYNLSKKIDLVYENTELIIQGIGRLEDSSRKQENLTKSIKKDLNKKWISKNKVIIFSTIAILLLALFFVSYIYLNKPFNMSIGLNINNAISVEKEYPQIGKDALIRFYFPAEVKELAFSNNIVLPDISSELKDKRIKIELIDRYWELVQDTLVLQKGNNLLKIQPNEQLAKVEGKVTNWDGSQPQQDVNVLVENQETKTNEYGEFHLTLPIEKRKPRYVITITKNGSKVIDVEYFAGSKKEIRLEKE